MKVLLTNLTLATRTGTEIVTRDLALGLARAGHKPCVFSPQPGDIADEIEHAGVPVVTRLEDVPFRPQIIHGHHHVETTLALVHFRNVPAIFVCHDRLSWYDSPPWLDGIRRYVAVDRNCLERLILEAGIPAEHTRLIPNSVDMRRFQPRRPLPEKPARALVFSNDAEEGAELRILREAAAESGIRLDAVGSRMAAQATRPEEILGSYDLVFAKARCALEALAVGCAVILCHGERLGPMVTGDSLHELREWNLGMRCLQQTVTPDAIRREIARYDRADAARVTELVRAEASLDDAVACYVRLYEEALADNGVVCASVKEAVENAARRSGSLEAVLRDSGGTAVMPPLPRGVGAQVGIHVPSPFHRIAAGASIETPVEIDNRSAETLASAPPNPVHVSYHWLDKRTGQCILFDGERTLLSAPVRPRSRRRQKARVLAPRELGRYVLVLTLVQERRFWFDQLPHPAAFQWDVEVVQTAASQPDRATLRDAAAWAPIGVVRDAEFMNLGFVSDPHDRMLTFAATPQFAALAAACPRTSCVLTTPELIGAFPNSIGLAVAKDPARCFFEIHNRLAAGTEFYGRDFPSRIDASARLHPRCWVDEQNVIIGAGVTVGPNASVLGRSALGEGAVIHAGAVIGAAGFQTSRRRGDHIEMAHAGTVEIGPECHVFANAVIARGLFRQSTSLGTRCRVGNGAFVSHNCVLGDEAFVGHGAVVNGNVRVGANAWIGPGATIVHGVTIGEEARVSLGATVVRDVEPRARVTGSLAIEHWKMLRLMSAAAKGRGQ